MPRERTNIPHTHGLVHVLHLLTLGSLTIPSPCLQALIHPSSFSFPSFSNYATSSQASPILQKPQKGAGMFLSLSHTVTARLLMGVFAQQWPGADLNYRRNLGGTSLPPRTDRSHGLWWSTVMLGVAGPHRA